MTSHLTAHVRRPLPRRHLAVGLLTAAAGCAAPAGAGFAPVVVATAPADGAAWPRDGAITLVFSEPMGGAGRVEAYVESAADPMPLEGAWGGADRSTFIAWPTALLPADADVVVVADGFVDRDGEAQAAPAVLALHTTIDDAPPRLVGSTPAAAAEVEAGALDEVVIEMSAPLDGAYGAIETEGPGLRAGAIRWGRGGAQLRVPIEGLLVDQTYAVRLRGFRGRNGRNVGLLELVFHTSPDRRPPEVLATWPEEGARVDAASVRAIVVAFDEPMDGATPRLRLDVDGVARDVWGRWADDGATLELPLASPLPSGARVRVPLAGLTDRAGNPPSVGALGGDGVLDFAAR